MKKATIRFNPPKFAAYSEPLGRLNHDRECHALFYYYTLAFVNYEREQNELVLEGDPDVEANYQKLYRNAAMMYNVDIEKMANYWLLVDQEIDRQNVIRVMEEGKPALPKLPDALRFVNRKIELRDKRKMN